MILRLIVTLFFAVSVAAQVDDKVIEVDFLENVNFEVNAAGPILVKVDKLRNRVVLVNTYTSSISIIDGKTHKVRNVAIKTRIPQYLKSGMLALDGNTGNVYLIGEKSVHVIFPDRNESLYFPTEKQFEMVAVDDSNGNAFLVGRESLNLVILDLKKQKLRRVDVFTRRERLININATPPPPIRKVICDPAIRRVFVTDGFSNSLFTFSADDGKLLARRKLTVRFGTRWHYGCYDPKTRSIFVAIETDERKVVQAAAIKTSGDKDRMIDLPGLTEGVGVCYSPLRKEMYITYDNHPVVHAVNFDGLELLSEIKIPAYGNDAAALDEQNQLLYVASWAYGEIEVIDLQKGKLIRRVRDVDILPHMFSMGYNPVNQKLYVPSGATAVNGSFGAAVTAFNVSDFSSEKIRTGWAPIDLIGIPDKESFLVFNSEDQYAEVYPDGTYQLHNLPFNYPCKVILSNTKTFYLSYGPHQSYWPTVYIWAAKNGIMEIEHETIETSGHDSSNFQIFDRRVPRLAQGMLLDSAGGLWCLQNVWGKESMFLSYFPQGIRLFSPQERIELPVTIQRETTPRMISYDAMTHKLYILKSGEEDQDAGKLIVFDPVDKKTEAVIETGITPVDLIYNKDFIYVANFDDNSISRITKNNYMTDAIKTGSKPLRMAINDKDLFVINHKDNTLQRTGDKAEIYQIEHEGMPDNLFVHRDKLIITSHSADALNIIFFNPENETFQLRYKTEYPFGETTFDTNNSSFYTRGQFGDAIFEITRIRADDSERLWIGDFLSGKLFIIAPD